MSKEGPKIILGTHLMDRSGDEISVVATTPTTFSISPKDHPGFIKVISHLEAYKDYTFIGSSEVSMVEAGLKEYQISNGDEVEVLLGGLWVPATINYQHDGAGIRSWHEIIISSGPIKVRLKDLRAYYRLPQK